MTYKTVSEERHLIETEMHLATNKALKTINEAKTWRQQRLDKDEDLMMIEKQ